MPSWLNSLVGINYKTTIAGLAAIVAAAGRIALAWKARDVMAIVQDGQLILETVGLVVVGLGLLKAKDESVTGTGSQAVTVDSAGTVTNREGDPIGKQPSKLPESSKALTP
jgi:hypothetical protein